MSCTGLSRTRVTCHLLWPCSLMLLPFLHTCSLADTSKKYRNFPPWPLVPDENLQTTHQTAVQCVTYTHSTCMTAVPHFCSLLAVHAQRSLVKRETINKSLPILKQAHLLPQPFLSMILWDLRPSSLLLRQPGENHSSSLKPFRKDSSICVRTKKNLCPACPLTRCLGCASDHEMEKADLDQMPQESLESDRRCWQRNGECLRSRPSCPGLHPASR